MMFGVDRLVVVGMGEFVVFVVGAFEVLFIIAVVIGVVESVDAQTVTWVVSSSVPSLLGSDDLVDFSPPAVRSLEDAVSF